MNLRDILALNRDLHAKLLGKLIETDVDFREVGIT